MKTITNNLEETQNLGADFAKKVKPGDVILLFGNLGAGKTTFVQGMAKGLGIKRRIISPTFIIIRKYELSVKRKALSVKYLYHIDLYRIQTENDLKELGIEEILEEKNSIVLIEWPEKLGKLMPAKRWELRFKTLDENKREIEIHSIR